MSAQMSTSPSTSTVDFDQSLHEALMQEALKVKSHLTRHRVRGDGNCFYRSVGEFTIGQENHLAVRRAVMDEVTTNTTMYASFCPDIEGWKTHMAEPGSWGDAIAVRAASTTYKKPVVIFREGTSQPPSIFIPPCSANELDLLPMY